MNAEDYTLGLFKVYEWKVCHNVSQNGADLFSYSEGGIRVAKIGENLKGKVLKIGTHKECWDFASENWDSYRYP